MRFKYKLTLFVISNNVVEVTTSIQKVCMLIMNICWCTPALWYILVSFSFTIAHHVPPQWPALSKAPTALMGQILFVHACGCTFAEYSFQGWHIPSLSYRSICLWKMLRLFCVFFNKRHMHSVCQMQPAVGWRSHTPWNW